MIRDSEHLDKENTTQDGDSLVHSYKEVVKILKKNGWQLKRTSGSHEIYGNPQGKTCPVKCTDKDIPIGTLKKIEKITGIKF